MSQINSNFLSFEVILWESYYLIILRKGKLLFWAVHYELRHPIEMFPKTTIKNTIVMEVLRDTLFIF